MLTQKRLKELLNYNPETGIFTWKTYRSFTAKAGSIAGCLTKDGYVQLKIDNRRYCAHRIAWLYVYGKQPNGQIDHIDHNAANNKIINLRDVDASGNQQNTIKARKTNVSTGVLGVGLSKCKKKYTAAIIVNYKSIHLGTFETIEHASAAYIKAKRELHATCTL